MSRWERTRTFSVLAHSDTHQTLLRDPIAWAILLAGAVLIFMSVDQRCLWQDEAETAMLARNILRFGKPVAFDGVNLVSQELGREFGSDFVWRWSPWAQFYIAAAAFRLLGQSTLAARLPFALCGLGTLIAAYAVASRAFLSAAVARWSVFFLAASVPFVLHVRQARWHAPAYLCVAMLMLAIFRRSIALLVIAGTSLFYVNYFVAICAIAALVVASAILGRETFLRAIAGAAITALLSLPGALYFEIFSRGAAGGWGQTLEQMKFYVLALPLPMIAIAVLLLLTRRVGRAAAFLIVFAALYIGAISFGPWRMFRYVTPLLPVTAILNAVVAAWMLQWRRVLGIVVIICLALIDPQYRRLPDYVGEITRGVRDADCAVCDFLGSHAKRSDVVLATYGDLPIAFYTGLHVAGGLQGRPLPKDPDWIVERPYVISGDPMKDAHVRNFIKTIEAQYETVLQVPDPPLGNSPDPEFHRFNDDVAAAKLIVARRRILQP